MRFKGRDVSLSASKPDDEAVSYIRPELFRASKVAIPVEIWLSEYVLFIKILSSDHFLKSGNTPLPEKSSKKGKSSVSVNPFIDVDADLPFFSAGFDCRPVTISWLLTDPRQKVSKMILIICFFNIGSV